MLQLDGLVKTKTITINGKVIKIPKISLYHYNLVKSEKDINKSIYSIVSSIHKGLSRAERDIVLLNLLEFNGKLKDTVVFEGLQYDLKNIKIQQKLEFSYQDYTFKFKTPTVSETFVLVEDMLNNSCISTKYKGELVDNIDFKNMPAFIFKWAEQILTTVSITDNSSSNTILGVDAITELFDG